MDNDINENGEDDINDEKRKDSSEKEEVREENDKSSEVDSANDECEKNYHGERSSELGSDSFDGSIEDGDIVILMKMWRII